MTNTMINGFEERWLFVENKRKLRIGLRQAGEQVLFLMHGVTRCWRDWEPIIPFLDPAWTIFALDHRGHGESDRADSYFVRDYAKDLVEVLNQIVDTRVVLVGHSLGAMVAAYGAGEVPERVKGVVMEDPPFLTMGQGIAGSTWQALFQGMHQVAQTVEESRSGSEGDGEGSGAVMGIDQIARLLGEVVIRESEAGTVRLRDVRNREALLWGASCLQHVDPAVFETLVSGQWLDGYNPKEVASKLWVPSVLLQADFGAGGALSDEEARFFSQGAAQCEWKRFPGKNHQLHGTIPGEIAAEINRFLA